MARGNSQGIVKRLRIEITEAGKIVLTYLTKKTELIYKLKQ